MRARWIGRSAGDAKTIAAVPADILVIEQGSVRCYEIGGKAALTYHRPTERSIHLILIRLYGVRSGAFCKLSGSA